MVVKAMKRTDPAAIDDINLTVRRSPGAGDIDLSNVIIEVFANGESATLTDDDGFEINEITNTDDVLSDSSDRAALNFTISSNVAEGAELKPGDTIALQVTTAAGGTAFVEKRAPSSIDSNESYRL